MSDSISSSRSLSSLAKREHGCGRDLPTVLYLLFAVLALGIAAAAAPSWGAAPPRIIQANLIKKKIGGLDHPKFITPEQADFMQSTERVIGVVVGKEAKAYPVRILRWHQVVNDVIGGRAVAVTYCPLTGNAAIYERYVNGKPVILSPTDKLYESTTMFSDSTTHSLWSQFNGVAITGPEKGKRLKQLASINTDWALWLAFHPKSLALSSDNGYALDYNEDPYGDYEGPGAIQFPVSNEDKRLPREDLVLGVDIDHHAEVFPLNRLAYEKKTSMTTEVGGRKITVVFEPRTVTVGAADNQHHIPAYTGQWFGWAAFHPNSEIWGKEPPKPPPPLPIIFKDGGDLNHAREGNSATLLKNGNVLIAGGDSGHPPMIAAAEIYDPVKHSFILTGSMKKPRGGHAATLLGDGRVLFTGGMDDRVVIADAEVYDPASGQFTAVGPMHDKREKHTATLLKNGMVLIAGGYPGDASPTASTELYDPAKQKFLPGPPMSAGRQDHSATLLADGRVLIAGGTGKSGAQSSAEIYDPATGRFTPTGSMNAARQGQAAVLLKNGKVLITGGAAGGAAAIKSAEIYDPATGRFTPAGDMEVAREGHRAVLLPSGDVLIVGGIGLNPQQRYLASAELYDPATGHFKLLGEMLLPRFGPTLTLLGNGQVLVTGRFSAPGYYATATTELYQPPVKAD
jgi:hypothetical protein